MKLLHVVPSMDPKKGGVCQAIRSIIHGLKRRAIFSEVVCLDEPGSPFLQDDHFTINAIGCRQGAWKYSEGLIPWLLKNLPQFDSVIVHGMWNFHAHAVDKAMSALRKNVRVRRRPAVYVMPHGMLDPYFQKATGRKLKALRNWAYWKLIERHVINNADGLLFSCEEERRLAAMPFRPYRPKSQLVTGLGIESPPPYEEAMSHAFIEKCPACDRKPYILFLGRIDEKKGVDLLIKAYKSFLIKYASVPNYLPQLVIAGPGSETPYGKQLERMVLSSSLQHQVHFPGMLTGRSKWGAFYGCDAFVLSSHQENFGIAIIEALACAKPVLITNQVNVWQEVEAEEAGFISSDTLEGVQYMLEKWFALAPEQKQITGMCARKLYETHFSADRMSERLHLALKNQYSDLTSF